MANIVTQRLDHRQVILQSQAVLHIWRLSEHAPRASVVLQHGFTEYAELYVNSHQQIVQHLCSEGYIVYALDAWGHGRSPGTARGVTHVGKAVCDHVEARKLAEKEGLSVFLAGFSLGGLITAASFVQKPSLETKGVILMYPALPEPTSAPVRAILSFGRSFMPKASIPLKGAPYEGHTRDPEQVRRVKEDPMIFKRPLPYLLAATALDEAATLWDSLWDWKVPTLVMHGTADTAISPKTSERFVSQIASQDKTLRLWTDGRHELLNDLEGQDVLHELLVWIRRHA